MNKVNEAGYNEAPKFGPSQNNPPYISDDFQIGPNGAYEHNETIKIQQELIDVLYSQVIDLSMMSKIELGDDVIAEIKRLKGLLKNMEFEDTLYVTCKNALDDNYQLHNLKDYEVVKYDTQPFGVGLVTILLPNGSEKTFPKTMFTEPYKK
jgi:hypothetical protein